MQKTEDKKHAAAPKQKALNEGKSKEVTWEPQKYSIVLLSEMRF